MREDLCNQRFGRLLVQRRINTSHFECVCDCGKKITVLGSSIKSGNTKSCGCFRRDWASESKIEDLTNQRFGRLLVIGMAPKDGVYQLDNCVPCCGICNHMKKDMSYDDFINHVMKITSNLSPKETI